MLMRELPRDPMQRQARSIANLCDDILDPQGRQSMPRLNALRSVAQKESK
jgi:hypothetical protein